ncbi:MAG: DUF3006 domain-containing protein [Clostridiales bacterium]|nr:DUF3006 domain-containing protein [Clostridiales bacterium]
MEKLIVDRFEGKFAVCEKEDLSTLAIALADLPENIEVGNVLWILQDGTYFLDKEEEKGRREKIESLFDSLFEDQEEK